MGPIISQDPNGKDQTKDIYESIEFTLLDGASDYDLDAQQATFRANLTPAHYLWIRTTQNITIKFNSATNHAITLDASSSTTFDRQQITNLYLSNSSGSGSSVRLYFK